MPIYEFYCPENHRIYQFYARSLAQAKVVPKCPDNPKFQMQKVLSSFAVVASGRGSDEAGEVSGGSGGAANPADDARMEAAMGQMEREFSNVDEKDPKAMGRMMRRMATLTGEKMDGEMEAVVRKLEEGADPDSLDEELGAGGGGEGDPAPPGQRGARARFRTRRGAPARDPRLYDYP
jgi:hypothetical protein